MDLDPTAEEEEHRLEDHNEAEDARALFGGSAAAAIDIDNDDCLPGATGTGSTSTPGTASTAAASSSSKRPPRSKVWNDFDELTHLVNGKRVRYGAVCKYCKQTLSGKSSSGTGHLLRHNCSAKKEQQRAGIVQSVLKYNPDGSLKHWEYSPAVARTELCRLIAKDDLPLWFGESDAFQQYITNAHNPKFVKSSRQTTARDFVRLYNERVAKLIETFNTSVASVALTSDIWNGKAKEDYISVVAHFVNSNWELEKRLIGLRLIDEAHTGRNIAERISIVVDEYGLTNKIFAITLDNASPNKTAMGFLKPLFSGYLGLAFPEPSDETLDDSELSDDPDDLSTVFLHQRCACHIINLIVKSCLTILKPYLDDFRKAITFLNSSNQRIAAYKSYCLSMGVTPRKFGVDMDVRWNSTFLMLKHLLPHRSTFSVFIQTQYPLQEGDPPLLTTNHWTIGEKVLSFLQLFYDSTVALSGVYYPTSPLMLHQILKIARHLNNYENDELLRQAVVPMKDKFLKYWREIPLLYAFAFILDPRAKMRGFHKVLLRLSTLTGTDYSRLPQKVRSLLTKTFQLYESKFGDVRLRAQHQTTSANEGRNKMAWDDIYGDDDFDGESSTSQSCRRSGSGSIATSSATFATASSVSELSSYLDSDTVSQFNEDFNILSWWHEHKLTYPILSLLAKDVMTVPASTISSESTFSLVGRVIEERRRRLTSDMVEILSCIKDWELADLHMQHNLEKDTKELEAIHESMVLEDSSPEQD